MLSSIRNRTLMRIKLFLGVGAILVAFIGASATSVMSTFDLTVVPVAANQLTCARVGTCDDATTDNACKSGDSQLYKIDITCAIPAKGIFTAD